MVNSEFARSPLAGAQHGRRDRVMLKEVPYSHSYDLRVAPGSSGYNEASVALGFVLPTHIGSSATSEQFTALCLGPDWWYVIGSDDLFAALSHALATTHISVVDVIAQRTRLEISGPHAAEVLAHYWEQDLRVSYFPTGACSQGVLAKAPVIVWHSAENCYVVYVRSSFAQHLWTALTDATVEYL